MVKKKLNKFWNYCIIKKKKWKPHNKNALCEFFFVWMTMQSYNSCTFNYALYLVLFHSCNSIKPKNKIKGLISHYKTSEITFKKKHIDADHSIIFKKNWKQYKFTSKIILFWEALQFKATIFFVIISNHQ